MSSTPSSAGSSSASRSPSCTGLQGTKAAIVNQRFAEVYLGAGNPIGRRLELRPPTAQRTYLREADGAAPPVRVTIVGVSPDIRQSQQDAVPMVYLPFRAEGTGRRHADRTRLRRTCARRVGGPGRGERDSTPIPRLVS